MRTMESGSVLSEPINIRSFNTPEKNKMTIFSQASNKTSPKNMSTLETLEAKMASIEVSLSSSAPRRRKGTSLGVASLRASPKPDTVLPSKELRSALAEREAVIQSLRVQLGLAKLPRPSGPAFDDNERPVAEQRMSRLKADAENKKVAIRNLKAALDKLDITDNIDSRIRQAELEYALGREELQLLSLVEESRALQARLDKSKPEANTIFSMLEAGVNLGLVAVRANTGRWETCTRDGIPGFWVDWAMEGEGLVKGDRLLEVNGSIVAGKTLDELRKLLSTSDKCELVVLRRKPVPLQQQQLQHYQDDNVRLQHRISYLEEQVNELQSLKEHRDTSRESSGGSHVTSISISSPPSTPPQEERPQVYQRGSFVAIVGTNGTDTPNKGHITTTLIKENSKIAPAPKVRRSLPRPASTISINGDVEYKRDTKRLYNGTLTNGHHKSVEYLNSTNGTLTNGQTAEKRRVYIETTKQNMRNAAHLNDIETSTDKDYTSEPVAARIRPTPPRKPLRLSLHRAQSLQTVEAVLADYEKKKSLKRPHRAESTHQLIENTTPMITTASLGRHRYV